MSLQQSSAPVFDLLPDELLDEILRFFLIDALSIWLQGWVGLSKALAVFP
ncbi:hypothetical protein ANO14919_126870 [Xylariales sp. No.14919]|nr:hypothetical protein ANO14919_126870 [Xylariales sp. No.14919]